MGKSKQLDFSGYDIFVGLDTHLKSWKTTVIVGDNVFKTFSQNPKPQILKNYLAKNFPNGNYYSAYEASFCGFTSHRELLDLGINNIVVNPADIPTTDKERKQKEDARDSRKIAKQLSQKDLKAIHVPDIDLEADRHLVRYRKTISKDLAREKARIKMQLYYFGIEIPIQFADKPYWSKKFMDWIEQVTLPTQSAKMVLNGHLDMARMLRNKQFATLKEIRTLALTERYNANFLLLQSVPGIGPLTAMILLTEIGEVTRFKTLDRFCSFIGLVPTTNSTGERESVGKITPRGNRTLRSALVESAWVAIRCDPALMLAYQKLVKRMKPQNAIIRIAKKLASRIMFVLKNKQEYVCAVVN